MTRTKGFTQTEELASRLLSLLLLLLLPLLLLLLLRLLYGISLQTKNTPSGGLLGLMVDRRNEREARRP